LFADREEQRDQERAEGSHHRAGAGHADHLRQHRLASGFSRNAGEPVLSAVAGRQDENKGIIGTWEVDVIDALKPAGGELVVINYGSDSFEGTDLDRILRAGNIGHLFVSGQCIEHVVATTIKRAANMGYNAILIKDATSGFTDANYTAMLDILPLYSKVISSDQFALEAPYGSAERGMTTSSKDSFTGRLAWLRA
jgi:nicotinamidase-related amidase